MTESDAPYVDGSKMFVTDSVVASKHNVSEEFLKMTRLFVEVVLRRMDKTVCLVIFGRRGPPKIT